MSTEDINFIKKFLKFQKMHKNVPATLPVPMGLDSRAYQLIIQRVGGLRRPSNPTLTLQFSIAANFFIQNQGDKCFFGRTFNSPRVNVEFGPDGVNYEHPPLPIYYHTRVNNNKDVPLLVILEVQAYESQQDLVLKRMHLGWCEVQALTIANNKLNFRKGSPRILLLGQQANFESSGIQVVCEIQYSEPFQMCMHLTPENALCGYGDELPGLKKSFVGTDFELCRSMVVFMSKIQVLIPEQLEIEIFKQVQKYRTYKYRTPEEYKGDIQIINKRLIVTFHNGWTFINTRGTNNFVPLGDTRMLVTEIVDSKQCQYKQLAYQGVIDINNVCSTDPTVNSGMLIVQLEYEAMFLVSNLTKETMQLILGWVPIYINNKFGTDELVDEEFIIGPGKTLDGRPLVAFSQDVPIKLRSSLNLSGGGFQINDLYMGQAQPQNQVIPPQQPQQPGALGQQFVQQGVQQGGLGQQMNALGMPMQQPAQPIYKNAETDLRTHVKLKEFEQQVLRLQEENERLRRLAIQQQGDPQKQQEYMQAIEKLRDENRLLQFTQAKQFEGLEKLIKEQKPSERSAAPPIMMSDAMPQNTVIKPIDSYAYPVPQATLKPMNRNDIIALVDDPVSADAEARLMALEQQDERKDQIIVIQPISMKQILGPYPVCKSIQLNIAFYDMPTYKTPFLHLEYYNDDRNFKFNLENGTPLRLLHNNESFSCKFTIEASLQRYQNLEMDFARYLFHKHLIIDVLDSESLFIYGSVRIQLRGLLRSGKHNSQIMTDVEIFDPQTQKSKGTLQLLLKNIGKIGQQDMSKTAPLASTANNGFQKKKLISEKPVNRMEVPAQQFDGDRIQDRIKKIKQQNLQELTKNKQSQQRSLNEVLKYKEIKKPQLVKTIMQSFLANEQVVHSFYGKSEIIPLYFKNTYAKPEQFTVTIEDPESRFLEYQEFFLLGNPTEWKYWVTTNKYPEPENYDMIRMKENQGKTQYYFILDPNQEVTLLFKFITFRQYDYRVDEQERTPEYIRKYMQVRHITVLLQHEGKMMDGLRIIVEPHQQPIDHVLRFYERENRQTRLIIPRLFNQPLTQQPRIHVTDPDVMVEWTTDFNSIRLNLRIGEPQSVRIFNILLYGDQYQNKLVANWKIEIYSLTTIDIEVPLGQRVSTKITFPCDITRIIKLNSSNRMITFIKPFDSDVTMLPGKINLVPISILSLQEGKHLVKLNGVDIHAQELIYSWLVNVHATSQPPSATYELRCIDGRESRHQVNYKNSVNYTTQYNITSSSDFVKLLDTTISTGPNEMVQFKIRVLPGCEEVVRIFLNDIDERIFDMILLNIKYVY